MIAQGLQFRLIIDPTNKFNLFSLEFEKASVDFWGGMGPMVARLRNGDTLEYRSPDATAQVAKLWTCAEAVTRDVPIPCGLETARPHASFIEAIENSGSPPLTFPQEISRCSDTAGGRLRWVEGLAGALHKSFATGELPKLPGVGS